MKIGLLSFGGPAGQIALMHRILVEEKQWVDEDRFLHALNYCMLLPGPEAQQLATYIGWLLHRIKGGLAAGILFILPGAVVILLLSILYAGFQQFPLTQAIFFGIKAAVLAVVIEAILRIGKRALKTRFMYTLAAMSFLAIFLFDVSFPLIIAAAGVLGFAASRLRPQWLPASANVATASDAPGHALPQTQPSLARAIRVSAVCLALWLLPIAGLAAWLGTNHVFVQEGIFFSKMAVVTFGGAYAVLAYMAQQAVETYGWLEPGEMLDGLGLAETTPGPLIMVMQFVGFLGAYRNPGVLDPFVAGTLGALFTTWVTFVPCFLWIFLGAPSVEAVRGNRALAAALSAITAAVVGVILNLAIWFGLHVMFGTVNEVPFLGATLSVPELATLETGSLLLTGAALLAMLRFHVGMLPTLAACALIGTALQLVL
ncbi:MAG: chromate efflux transporter [Proteobacteria bacterium]|nr:chromate efflux transporter [Pseudomonadota bacterium]